MQSFGSATLLCLGVGFAHPQFCTLHYAFKLYFSAITDVSFIIICEYDAHSRFFKIIFYSSIKFNIVGFGACRQTAKTHIVCGTSETAVPYNIKIKQPYKLLKMLD